MNHICKLFLVLITVFSFNCGAAVPETIFIRVNQLGFLPGDFKTAVIFSKENLIGKKVLIKEKTSNKIILEYKLKNNSLPYDKFKFSYTIDFTKLKEHGSYLIEIEGQRSNSFKIDSNVYTSVVDSLLLFFQVQRCGPTNPYLHKVCHLSDVAKLAGYKNDLPVDVTGGWHDAGDYIKFFSTAAYSTYLMLFAYEFDKSKFEFDNNNNGAPDILEEARVGIDWMLRCNFEKGKLITQVQDLKDHEVGWRLPEEDNLQYERGGFVNIGKNQVGMFAAVMSLASRIWSSRFYDHEFANKLLKAAEQLYSFKDKVPDIDQSASGFYQDNHFWGKLSLGAIELYLSKKEKKYLDDAKVFADSAHSDFWWSWGNINSLAHYKIAKIEPRFKKYIKDNLIAFNSFKNKSVFNEGAPYTWGTTNTLLGVALQAILYKDLTKSILFDSLAVIQRDYILGRNPWGISFIYNTGKEFPQNFHSQVAYFNNGYLPGAIAAGPAPVNILNQFDIKRENFKYNFFNTDSVKYFDDRMDYITNEPTIATNATGLFVFGYYSGRK